jgi:serine/threonine protein kinase
VRVTAFGLVRAVEDNPKPDGEPAPEPLPDLEPLGATTADDRTPPAPITAAAAPPTNPPTPTTATPALRTPITRVGAVMGTPGYMAPEQYRAAPVDARTDQFAFCASLYEALWGERPFEGRTPDETAARTLHAEPRPPSTPRVPAHLRRLVLRGLAKDPAARFPDLTALLDALVAAPARRRRRLVAAALAFVVSGTIAASLRLAPGRRDGDLCRGAAA